MSTFEIKQKIRSIKNTILNVPELEAKVREATSDDPWGAPGAIKQEISRATYN